MLSRIKLDFYSQQDEPGPDASRVPSGGQLVEARRASRPENSLRDRFFVEPRPDQQLVSFS